MAQNGRNGTPAYKRIRSVIWKRIETGELKMNINPFKLQTLVQTVIEHLDYIAERNQIRLYNFVPHTLALVLGDQERLQQVLTNLIENGIKYNHPGGRVEITVQHLATDKIQLTVSDDGIGIPHKDVKRVTERFFRVDKSRSREQGGTGLGLSIVKHILHAHHSQLRVHSTLTKGTVFSFELSIEP